MPESTSVPTPILLTLVAIPPSAITPDSVVVAPPATSKVIVLAPVRVFVKFKLPAAFEIWASAVRAIAPARVLVLARLRTAPAAPTPVPAIESGSAIDRPLPSISSAAPVPETTVLPAAEPSAALLCARITPALIVVMPV